MLLVEGLNVYRGNIHALRGVSLSVQEGEIVSLVGANGAGKSTLLYALAGVLPVAVSPSAGKISYRGKQLCDMTADRTARLGISLVPEGRQVFGTLTVRDNLLLGTYVHTSKHWRDLLGDIGRVLRQEAVQRRLKDIYTLFPVLEERTRQLAGSLSGGEQQMLAIGRALMSSPRLLLVDELSMGLAPALVSQLFGLLSQLRASGLTILLVEQDARAALRVADRGYILETGRIVADGPAIELLNSERIQRAYLGKGESA